jgi:RNA polymerase sigma factor (sigma-70 family)
MSEDNWLAAQFEENRGHLRAVAYRLLGSASEADDAIQEAWLRLSRTDAGGIQNLGGWLTTVVGRVCLDMLRSRASRREQSIDEPASKPIAASSPKADPEQEALLADSVGLALLVVLDRLTPPERLAFVLHDLFAVSFEEIASLVGRTPAAARQLASRARRRVQGAEVAEGADLASKRNAASSFLAALRAGDVDGLLAVLDPDLVVHVDGASAAAGQPVEVRGAANWAPAAITFSRGARFAAVATVNGEVGLIVAPGGRLFRAVKFTFRDGKIAEIEVIGEPARLGELDLAVPVD